MLTGLKVLSLACKYIFYKPEHMQRGNPMNRTFKFLKCKKKKRKILMDRAQRLDEKK